MKTTEIVSRCKKFHIFDPRCDFFSNFLNLNFFLQIFNFFNFVNEKLVWTRSNCLYNACMILHCSSTMWRRGEQLIYNVQFYIPIISFCNMLLNNKTNSIQFHICSLFAYVSSTLDHELFMFL